MKRHFLLRMFVINMFLYCVASGCPCGFSADNAQPFFEQYELKNNVIKPNEKEKTHKKNYAFLFFVYFYLLFVGYIVIA